MNATEIRTLVDEGASLKARMKADADRLKEIESRLVPLGAGSYEGTGGAKATVVVPGPTLKPDAKTVEELKASLGDTFGKLFDRVVSFKPVKGFREIAAAVLTPAKARKLIASCEVDSSPYVKFS